MLSAHGAMLTPAHAQAPVAPAPPVAAPLPATIPLFPLPDVVLFPGVSVPLRIFEPRYRAMVADALKGDRIIGMVLLRPGYEADYEGRPPVVRVGCAGVITEVEQQANGEYLLILRGLQRFEIARENAGGAYRTARIAPLPEPAADGPQRAAISAERRRVETLLARLGIATPPAAVADADVVVGLAQILELTAAESQELLERDGVLARLRSLADRLEALPLPSGNRAQRVHVFDRVHHGVRLAL